MQKMLAVLIQYQQTLKAGPIWSRRRMVHGKMYQAVILLMGGMDCGHEYD